MSLTDSLKLLLSEADCGVKPGLQMDHVKTQSHLAGVPLPPVTFTGVSIPGQQVAEQGTQRLPDPAGCQDGG